MHGNNNNDNKRFLMIKCCRRRLTSHHQYHHQGRAGDKHEATYEPKDQQGRAVAHTRRTFSPLSRFLIFCDQNQKQWRHGTTKTEEGRENNFRAPRPSDALIFLLPILDEWIAKKTKTRTGYYTHTHAHKHKSIENRQKEKYPAVKHDTQLQCQSFAFRFGKSCCMDDTGTLVRSISIVAG